MPPPQIPHDETTAEDTQCTRKIECKCIDFACDQNQKGPQPGVDRGLGADASIIIHLDNPIPIEGRIGHIGCRPLLVLIEQIGRRSPANDKQGRPNQDNYREVIIRTRPSWIYFRIHFRMWPINEYTPNLITALHQCGAPGRSAPEGLHRWCCDLRSARHYKTF
jgi:hypothetical protein